MLSSSAIERFNQLKRDIISDSFSQLNPEQKKCVLHGEGPMLILAGAGSGKTTVLINRIAYLIRYGLSYSETVEEFTEEDLSVLEDYRGGRIERTQKELGDMLGVQPVDPWRILVITFTNKAAQELKNRLASRLDEEQNEVWASTFHSFCANVLRRECEVLGYRSDFTIYDADDAKRLVKNIIADLRLDEKRYSPKTICDMISRAKDELKSAAVFNDEAGSDEFHRVAGEIYTEYEKRLMFANAMDFDDLIYQTVFLFKNFPEVLRKYSMRFKWVMVDEFQDTNKAQYILVKMLSQFYGNICVVGDDDQSIYGFRGAKVENMFLFSRDFENTAEFKLEENYRSTRHILNSANGIIAHNHSRKGKTLRTNGAEGEKITVYRASDEQAEADFITDSIIQKVRQGGKWADNTILYRMNAQSNAIEQSLRYHSVPYRIIGGTRFFDRAEIRDVMAYLQLISNPFDLLRLERIVNVPTRGIGAKTFSTLVASAEANGISVISAMMRADEISGISSKGAASCMGFAKTILDLNASSRTMPLDAFYDEVLEKTGYRTFLEQSAEKDTTYETKLENVLELKSNIIKYGLESENPSLGGFLEETGLLTDIDRSDDTANAVTLMTIHSSKGLEFDRVYIAGCEEGIFPSSLSTDSVAGIEEERRLAYVAVTRAKTELFMTYAGQRMLFGRTSFNEKSRFLSELPEDSIVCKGVRETRKKWEFDLADDSFFGEDVPYKKTGYGYRPAQRFPSENRVPKKTAPSAAGTSGLQLNVGDRICHDAFGEGTVLSKKPVASDFILEIRFDTVGVKKMMQNFAVKYMRKL